MPPVINYSQIYYVAFIIKILIKLGKIFKKSSPHGCPKQCRTMLHGSVKQTTSHHLWKKQRHTSWIKIALGSPSFRPMNFFSSFTHHHSPSLAQLPSLAYHISNPGLSSSLPSSIGQQNQGSKGKLRVLCAAIGMIVLEKESQNSEVVIMGTSICLINSVLLSCH